ncbi:MAG: hypothetical protein K8S98_06430 [Planctomycetes bacterium]|nr:hypothetical protein [Planctomycetota bacterium]
MDGDRLALAEAFLQEAVFQSRAKQAAGAALASGASAKPTNCGLGREAAIVLELSARGEELLRALFAKPLAEPELARLDAVRREWIERQDQLDRDRNHFLKAFRQRHGFDRRAYTPALLAEFEAGLADVNARADRERNEHAARLLRPVKDT